MLFDGIFIIWFIIPIIICGTPLISFNLPKLCPFASWYPDGVTFSNKTTTGTNPFDIFIDKSNSIYVAADDLDKIKIWSEGNNSSWEPHRDDSIGKPKTIFVTVNGDIYVGNDKGTIHHRTSNSSNYGTSMQINGTCLSLFIDINDSVYCTLKEAHQVEKISQNNSTQSPVMIAGTGNAGTEANMLNSPHGIFVDKDFALYVADCRNNRIQKFPFNKSHATTVAGEGVADSIELNYPIGVVLDADGYLFITDRDNHRIVGSGPFGFRCIIGCSNSRGSQSHQLNSPRTLRFDNQGNIYVVNVEDHRIQKFSLATNSCRVSHNQPKLSSCALWNPNATTVKNITRIDNTFFVIFINTNNTVYAASQGMNQVEVRFKYDRIIQKITPNNSYNSLNAATIIGTMNHSDRCISFFIDYNYTYYCSMDLKHKVVKLLGSGGWNKVELAAGNGTNGSNSYLLDTPNGIFIDMELNLYVADSKNNRIQLFQQGNMSGTTVAGTEDLGTRGLDFPTGVVLDADGHLFITDRDNHRIIQSDRNGFRCLVGCSGREGSTSNELSKPQTIWFDLYGNIFVFDKENHRVQKFLLSTNSCVETSSSSIMWLTCWSLTRIGLYCNISGTQCDLLRPCQNDGICVNDNTLQHGYNCLCPDDFSGIHCEIDRRPCQSNTCWNNGTCNKTSDVTFNCTCTNEWEGIHCERKKNNCHNIICENGGVCRSLVDNYTCECLGDSYYGRHCEFTATKIVIYKIVSKSFAYVAIIAMVVVVMFVIIMDILKYCFGIDPVHRERERLRREKRKKKHKPVIQRFVYVNAPPTPPQSSENAQCQSMP